MSPCIADAFCAAVKAATITGIHQSAGIFGKKNFQITRHWQNIVTVVAPDYTQRRLSNVLRCDHRWSHRHSWICMQQNNHDQMMAYEIDYWLMMALSFRDETNVDATWSSHIVVWNCLATVSTDVIWFRHSVVYNQWTTPIYRDSVLDSVNYITVTEKLLFSTF